MPRPRMTGAWHATHTRHTLPSIHFSQHDIPLPHLQTYYTPLWEESPTDVVHANKLSTMTKYTRTTRNNADHPHRSQARTGVLWKWRRCVHIRRRLCRIVLCRYEAIVNTARQTCSHAANQYRIAYWLFTFLHILTDSGNFSVFTKRDLSFCATNHTMFSCRCVVGFNVPVDTL